MDYEKELQRSYTRTLKDWVQFSVALITLSTFSVFIKTPATTTHEVEFHSNRLPDELIPLCPQRRRLIRVITISRRPEDKLALNRLHRRIGEELLAHHNRLWETKL
ncbi:hypothetical protein Zmor_019074 [Zophobas morio]|uniref:Uncharacterized protein n=1 Tax=Zophobas morio TaxID=2755281 RepID=A0AA38M046_9CUCU|nr:hypothetical protein Zmor_019074 [Zophobas morio]